MRSKKLFEKIVRMEQPDLKHWLGIQLQSMGYLEQVNDEGFLYAPGAVPVMLIAHLDTVHKHSVKDICWDRDYNVAMSPQGIGGDDRCGIYMILRIIKDLKCHVLFCEDEEIGGKGADAFAHSPIKPVVNFLIEFDRKGSNDAVFYNCDNKDFTAMVESHGFEEDYGSFSDISSIAPALKVAAVNLSSGYYEQHTLHEWVNMSEMNRNADRAAALIREESGTRYEYIEGYRSSWRRGYGYGWSGYWNDDWKDGWDSYGNRWTAAYRQQQKDEPKEDGSLRLMTLSFCAVPLTVMSEEADWEISWRDAGDYAIDEDENLYYKYKGWTYLETPLGIVDRDNDYVRFNRNRAYRCHINWEATPPKDDPSEEGCGYE